MDEIGGEFDPKNIPNYLLAIVASIFIASNIALVEPWNVPFHDGELPPVKANSAVILGGGPAALIAGHVLLHKGYGQLFFVEWRSEFT